MLKITSTYVVDRNSNRTDSVAGILGSDRLGGCFKLRCLMHQMCFAFVRAINHPRTGGHGFKRFAYEFAPMPSASPQPWQLRLATSTARGARSAG